MADSPTLIMSSNPPDVSELLRLLLAQQPQAAPVQQAQYAAPQAAQVASDNSGLSQLMDYLRSASNTAPASAPPKPKPEDIHAQLQRYLQGGRQSEAAVVPPALSPAFRGSANSGAGGDPPVVFPLQRASPPQQVQQQPSIQLLLQALNQQQLNLGVHQQQQQLLQKQEENLLSSIKLLASINPGMAAAALTQALSMTNQNTLQQIRQNPQQGPSLQSSYQPNELPSPVSYTQPIAPQTNRQIEPPSPFLLNHQLRSDIQDQGLPVETNQENASPALGSNSNGITEQGNQPTLSQVSTITSQGVITSPPKQKKENKSKKKQSTTSTLAPIAATTAPKLSTIHTPDEAILQDWNLEQLEHHVQQLKLSLQPIPRHVAILLFNARRREEKLKAKRISNRKSANTLRAKKKVFIETLTKQNATLRKRAFILHKMPDLVIATKLNGEITFCGAQVESFLNYNTDDLVGSNIQDLIAPDSRKTLKRLFRDRLTDTSGQKPSEVEDSPSGSRGEDKGSNSNGSSNANVVSMQSFPMLEVNMDATQQPSAAGDDVSESSADNNRKRKNTNNDATSSLTRQNSSFGTYFSSNENANPYAIKQVKIQKTDSGNATSSKSSGGAEDKIHHHKELVKSKAAVLADRSLSSTTCNSESQKKRSEDEAEDFGYREPESPDGSTNTERGENRGKCRLIPVYKVKFVRSDLTTIWCELTSSFCTKAQLDDESSFDAKAGLVALNNRRGLKKPEPDEPEEEKEDELLICIRPTYESKKITSKEYLFVPKSNNLSATVSQKSSSSSGHGSSNSSSYQTEMKQSCPPKKRPVGNDDDSSPSKNKTSVSLKKSGTTGGDVNTVVESLLALHSNN